MENMMDVVQEQLKNNPKELKKLKKKMKKWGNSPEGQKNITKMLQAMSGLTQQQQPSAGDMPQELEPKDILRKKIKTMKDKRMGKK